MDEGERAARRRRRFVTLRDVAEMLSVDDRDVEAILESGELPGIRIGERNEWRIEQALLDAYLEAKYEESRRAALFRGSDHASLADLDGARNRIRPSVPPAAPAAPASPTGLA